VEKERCRGNKIVVEDEKREPERIRITTSIRPKIR